MSENLGLVARLKQELASFDTLSERGFALLTKEGEVLYSELSSDAEQKIMLFKLSFPGLTPGSNITLLAKPRTLVVMCTSEKVLMALQTRQSIGVTLVKLSTIAKKYADEFDKYADTTLQENKNKSNKQLKPQKPRKRSKKAKSPSNNN
jgi:esterase/lipase